MSLPKQITFIKSNRDYFTKVVKKFCEPIISTLGPGGCTVIIADNDNPVPHVTKDGVTVAESIYFKDQREQAIAALIKEAARKTAAAVGDGTTTSVVLAASMILKGLGSLKNVQSTREFFDGFDLALDRITNYLSDSAVPIAKDSDLLASVVKISTNNDEKICKVVMSAVKDAGPDGIVNVELHDELMTKVDVKGGASLESKAIVPNGKLWETSRDVDLLLVNGALNHVYEIKPLIIQLSSLYTTAPVVIVAKEFSEEVINTFTVNNRNLKIDVALVEAEGFARESRLEVLQDLATIFSVPVYSLDGSTEYDFNDYKYSPCELLSKAVITPTETILFRSNDVLNAEAARRYTALKKEYDETKTSAEVVDSGSLRHLQRRMAKYNVVATIKVGASTKAEAVEVKDRIEDSLHAISAAINGGITQGGGMALARASWAAKKAKVDTFTKDEMLGYVTVCNSCLAPLNTLIENTGVSKDPIIYLENSEDMNDSVYDFRNCIIVNWLDGGIIDPVLVPISALTNAASVAKTILKSNSIISEWQDTTEE